MAQLALAGLRTVSELPGRAAVRAPVGGSFMLGGEVKFQSGTGDLDSSDFLGNKIDLGGVTYSGTLTWRF